MIYNVKTNYESVNLDLLRSIAVLFVVFSHIPGLESIPKSGILTEALGFLGVSIFFVHTCLVLMYSLQRHRHVNSKNINAISFYIRRVFRIYPLSMATVLCLYIFSKFYSENPLTLVALSANLLLIQNITNHPSITGALWSLPYEVQMYIILPAFFLFTTSVGKNSWKYILLLWTLLVGLMISTYTYSQQHTLFS